MPPVSELQRWQLLTYMLHGRVQTHTLSNCPCNEAGPLQKSMSVHTAFAQTTSMLLALPYCAQGGVWLALVPHPCLMLCCSWTLEGCWLLPGGHGQVLHSKQSHISLLLLCCTCWKGADGNQLMILPGCC